MDLARGDLATTLLGERTLQVCSQDQGMLSIAPRDMKCPVCRSVVEYVPAGVKYIQYARSAR